MGQKARERQARLETALKHTDRTTDAPTPGNPQLDDGGSWCRCTGCDSYKRNSHEGEHEIMCVSCGEPMVHVPDTPSFAVDG